jgi:hypothetical protein
MFLLADINVAAFCSLLRSKYCTIGCTVELNDNKISYHRKFAGTYLPIDQNVELERGNKYYSNLGPVTGNGDSRQIAEKIIVQLKNNRTKNLL